MQPLRVKWNTWGKKKDSNELEFPLKARVFAEKKLSFAKFKPIDGFSSGRVLKPFR
jgi:hypothetical protein